MPRKSRVEYAGAIEHVMSRGDQREDIFVDDSDWQEFLKTLAEAWQQTGIQKQYYGLIII
jgi:putative transposase